MSARRGLALLDRLFGLDGRAVQMLGDGAAVDGQERPIVLRVRLGGKRLTGGPPGGRLARGGPLLCPPARLAAFWRSGPWIVAIRSRWGSTMKMAPGRRFIRRMPPTVRCRRALPSSRREGAVLPLGCERSWR